MNLHGINNVRALSRDLGVGILNNDKIFDAKNIRFTALKDSEYFTITNEKGTVDMGFEFKGDYVGHAILNLYLIVFTRDKTNNFIYRCIPEEGVQSTLFSGDLNIHKSNPIETIPIFENKDIQKIYWTDGVNQPRVINISPSNDYKIYNTQSFDFVLRISLKETITVKQSHNTSSLIKAGTIQYVCTYYNKYGSETNPFYISDLYNISDLKRGLEVNKTSSSSFNILILNYDTSFDFIRVYAIYRSSLNGSPQIRKVLDVSTTANTLINHLPLDKIEGFGEDDLNMFFQEGTLFPIDKNGEVTHISELYIQEETIKNEDGSTYERYRITSEETPYLIYKLSEPSYVKLIPGHIYIIEYFSDNKGDFDRLLFKEKDGNKIILTEKLSDVGELIAVRDVGRGEILDNTSLLFTGGEFITALTMASKDNTLFLGGIKLTRNTVSKDIRKKARELKIKYKQFDGLSYISDLSEGVYNYHHSRGDSRKILTYKYGETYRFGLLFIHKTGKITEPIFINDFKNDIKPMAFYLGTKVVHAFTSLSVELLKLFYNAGYRKVRGVVVFPDIIDKDVIALGILSPTIFNIGDSINNNHTALSSWNYRLKTVTPFYDSYLDIRDKEPNLNTSELYPDGHLTWYREYNRLSSITSSHMFPFPVSASTGAELPCIRSTPNIALGERYSKFQNYLIYINSSTPENFYVDESILTLNSPDLELGKEQFSNINLDNYKLRIIGTAVTSNNSATQKINIDKPVLIQRELFNDVNITVPKYGIFGNMYGQRLLSNASANSKMILKLGVFLNSYVNFLTYPWMRNGSIINDTSLEEYNPYAELKTNKSSGLLYCDSNDYFEKDYLFTDESKYLVADMKYAYQDYDEIIKLNRGLDRQFFVNYRYNVNKLITVSLENSEYTTKLIKGTLSRTNKLTAERFDFKENTNKGYPIFGFLTQSSTIGSGSRVGEPIENYRTAVPLSTINSSAVGFSKEPVHIKYKSTPHVVISLGNLDSGKDWVSGSSHYKIYNLSILPGINENNKSALMKGYLSPEEDKEIRLILENLTIDRDDSSVLFIAEIYKDSLELTKFGGVSELALSNNIWLPAGEFYILEKNPEKDLTIEYYKSDTYYQRFDALKTYAHGDLDKNSYTDIASFYCESRINLEGRYDRNRGKVDNTAMSPKNFNLFNDVYQQYDTYFPNIYVDYDSFNLTDFPNSITWTKEKLMADTVDAWTNITMANTLDLDGDKGSITSLNVFNNEIYCLLDRGVSLILFNSRVLIAASDGVPIELAVGQKVQGKRYISNIIGCQNKWSIQETSNGIYFLDGNLKDFLLFNGLFTSISTGAGMKGWFLENIPKDVWNAKDLKGVNVNYDLKNKDLYITTDKFSLVYSEINNSFTSFYDYNGNKSMFSLDDYFYSFYNGKVWKHGEGEYNDIYNQKREWYLEFLSNDLPLLNKIFNTLEFRGSKIINDKDSLENPINFLKIRNNYLEAEVRFPENSSYLSDLKRKFRVWRANIPRDNSDKRRTRIANEWSYIKIGNDIKDNKLVKLIDFNVHYTI